MATDDAGTTISSAPKSPNMQQRYMPSRCHQVPRMPRETKVDTHGVDSVCQSASATANVCAQQTTHLLSPVQHKLPRNNDKVSATDTSGHERQKMSSMKADAKTAPVVTGQRRDKKSNQNGTSLPAVVTWHRSDNVPRLPRKVTASATPATQSNNRCRQVPRLPHKVKVDVTKCHACHAKRRGVTAPWLTKRATRANPVP